MSGKCDFFLRLADGFQCTANNNKKKNTQKSLLIPGTDRHFFHNGTAAKKATRTSSALSSLETVQKAREKKEREREIDRWSL